LEVAMDLEELNKHLNDHVKTIAGVPLTKVDVTVRFMVYTRLMKEYGIDRGPIMVIADRMPLKMMEVQHNPSKLVN